MAAEGTPLGGVRKRWGMPGGTPELFTYGRGNGDPRFGAAMGNLMTEGGGNWGRKGGNWVKAAPGWAPRPPGAPKGSQNL